MATNYFLNRTSAVNAADNWSLGAPSAGQDLRIETCTVDLLGALTTYAATAFASLYLGRGVLGRVGGPGNPLQLGTTTKIIVDSPRATSIYLQPSACTLFAVADANVGMDSLGILGTITDLTLSGASMARVWATTTRISLSKIRRSLTVIIEESATTATVINQGAELLIFSAVSALVRHVSGKTTLAGTGGKTFALIEQYAGEVDWQQADSTITDAKVYGGVLTGRNSDRARTLTNGEVWTGGTIDLNDTVVTVSNPIKLRGGRTNVASVTNQLVDMGGVPL